MGVEALVLRANASELCGVPSVNPWRPGRIYRPETVFVQHGADYSGLRVLVSKTAVHVP
jgi:hypothetical protein